MARKPSPLDALSAQQHEMLQADVMRGELSWRGLQDKWKIPFNTIRDYAERKGLERNPTGAKRQLVERLLAQPDPGPAAVTPCTEQQPVHQSVQEARTSEHRPDAVPAGDRTDLEKAAEEDARDMRVGLAAARAALVLSHNRLANAAAKRNSLDAREMKTISETVGLNIRLIREIRGLDREVGGNVVEMTDDELEALAKGKKAR